MIILDDIIFYLQKYGGVSNYFKSFIDFCDKNSVLYRRSSVLGLSSYGVNNASVARYLTIPMDFSFETELVSSVFSSYYRLPSQGSARYYCTVHDCIYERFRSGAARCVHVWQKRRAMHHATKIIAVSNSTADDLCRFYPEYSSKVVVIRNGFCSASFFKDVDQINDNSILFVGSRGSYKNFTTLVYALSVFTKYSVLKIVGGGDLSSFEIQMLRSNGIRFIYLGNVSDEDLRIHYACSGAFVYPSLYEGFGIPVLECMASGGLPVVSNTKALVEASGGNAVSFSGDSVPDLVASLETVFSSTFPRDEYINRGLSFVRDKSWHDVHAATASIVLS